MPKGGKMGTWKFQGSFSSGEKTSSVAIMSGPGWLCDFLGITDGTTNDGVFHLKDAVTDTGIVVLDMVVRWEAYYGAFTWNFPIRMVNGIYLKMSGTGASGIVSYIPDA